MSRLQKLHNVSLILNALYKGADVRPNPKQIVDGQRDVTLALLWRLLYEFELRMLIQPDRVLEEVQSIRRSRFHFTLAHLSFTIWLHIARIQVMATLHLFSQ